VLPTIENPFARRWEIHEQAANRHRGIVIEGGCPIEQVLDLVDWMPKLRMNAYMLQFKASGSFWRRWYVRTDLPVIENPHWLSFDECAELDARVIADLQRRGMLFHRVGHGWTCEAVGTLAAGWDKFEQPPESVRGLLAEVNGKREWFDGGIPLNTELCYSQPEVRQRVVDTVLAYAVEHPEIDVLHVWASDGLNNCCECPDCAALQPSDWYITLINEIAVRLAAECPRMRIAALCYSNTMWPPEQIAPSGIGSNVIFMFAPISRCYSHAILDPTCVVEPPLTPYRRNQVTTPRANADYAAMLRAWQQYLPAGTDSFVFDYHLWVNAPNELLNTNYRDVIHDDAAQYHGVGVNGIMSCQMQRVCVPTALAQYTLGISLWDARATSAEIGAAYGKAAFGPDAELAQACLDAFAATAINRPHDRVWMRMVTKPQTKAVLAVIKEFLPRLSAARAACTHPTWRLSLRLLIYFLRYQRLLWQALAMHFRSESEAIRLLDEAKAYLVRTEPRYYRWIDTVYWTGLIDCIAYDWKQQAAVVVES